MAEMSTEEVIRKALELAQSQLSNYKTLRKDHTSPECSCLDSAYERKAIDEGMNDTPVFPENIEYLKQLRRQS